jgi:hypothetical protein
MSFQRAALVSRWHTLLLLLIVMSWIAWTTLAVTRQGTWVDETNYLVKALWYVTGVVKPYSNVDLTAYMPLHFFALGTWQMVLGHGVITSRLFSVLLTCVNFGLMTHLLRQLGARNFAIAIALAVFALNEESVFYFSSATPYAEAVFLQLLALNVLVAMIVTPRVIHAILLAVLLTLIYLLRIDLSLFIAIILGAVLFRVRRFAWLTTALSATVFVLTLAVLTLLWGRPFIYVGMFIPGMPDLYPAIQLSHTMSYTKPVTFEDMLRSALRWEIIRDWISLHHAPAILAIIISIAVAPFRSLPLRGWIAFFTGAYLVYLLFYLLAGQFPGRGPQAPGQCAICVQAYLNYVDYLAALAIGLASQAVITRLGSSKLSVLFSCGIAGLFFSVILFQAVNLRGSLALPSALRQTGPLPRQVSEVAATIKNMIPSDEIVAPVGYDRRILLALAANDIRFPAWSLIAPANYRRLNDGLSSEQQARATVELESLSSWTDTTAERWLHETYNWLLVQDLPVYPRLDWMIWHPQSPLVTDAINRCFVKLETWTIENTTPLLQLSLYRRRDLGSKC